MCVRARVCVCVDVCVLVRSVFLLSFTTYLKYTWNINAEIKLSFPLRLGNSFVFCLSGFFLSLSDTHFSLSACRKRKLCVHCSIFAPFFNIYQTVSRIQLEIEIDHCDSFNTTHNHIY